MNLLNIAESRFVDDIPAVGYILQTVWIRDTTEVLFSDGTRSSGRLYTAAAVFGLWSFVRTRGSNRSIESEGRGAASQNSFVLIKLHFFLQYLPRAFLCLTRYTSQEKKSIMSIVVCKFETSDEKKLYFWSSASLTSLRRFFRLLFVDPVSFIFLKFLHENRSSLLNFHFCFFSRLFCFIFLHYLWPTRGVEPRVQHVPRRSER